MVPGESFLELTDELDAEPSISLITARHEGGAAFMAEGFAKASCRPAVCLGTRIVGSANMPIGLRTALQDSSTAIGSTSASADSPAPPACGPRWRKRR